MYASNVLNSPVQTNFVQNLAPLINHTLFDLLFFSNLDSSEDLEYTF